MKSPLIAFLNWIFIKYERPWLAFTCMAFYYARHQNARRQSGSEGNSYCYRAFMRCYQYVIWLKFNSKKLFLKSFIEKYFNNLEVVSGLFSGLRYPTAASAGSVLIPKLLGIYESELSFVFKKVQKNKYDLVVDIGCAEGFYAVGFALLFPSAKVHCFDTDTAALALLNEMAKYNNVVSQIEPHGYCSPQNLSALVSKRRCLIVSDCEGFERELFTLEIVKDLTSCDCIIELHERIHGNFGNILANNFSQTHKTVFIESKYDLERVLDCEHPLLNGQKLSDKVLLVSELRPTSMRWLFLEAETGNREYK